MYRVIIERQVDKDVVGLPPKIVGQIIRKAESLAENPRPQDCKRVISRPGELRVDSGEYRIFYTVDDAEQVVTVLRVLHRREAYRER
ncbi:MAG: type II toxin-antitoxin system RelE/ParE family toxin [Chloroflexi bacterium]|nr:type II toxin-antitoxin system RelE/ParE family toxin [Chloroflexota bacterium]